MRRIASELLVAEIIVDRIQPEAVDAAVEPELHRLEHRILHFPAMEIEIRLRGQEIVLVILAAYAVPFPAGTAEDRQPVVRRCTIRLRVGPDIPVRFWIGPARPALDEPGMAIGGMRDHLVDDDLDAEPVRFRHHLVEIGKRPEDRIDVAVIGNVVAHIGHRRFEERGKPDRIDAEAGDIRQPAGNPLEVAEPIAVGVLKRARIDLIDHRAAPPVRIPACLQCHRLRLLSCSRPPH
ncbi:hypothetical protein ACVITL_003289 [Rhizobium pisi]